MTGAETVLNSMSRDVILGKQTPSKYFYFRGCVMAVIGWGAVGGLPASQLENFRDNSVFSGQAQVAQKC